MSVSQLIEMLSKMPQELEVEFRSESAIMPESISSVEMKSGWCGEIIVELQ